MELGITGPRAFKKYAEATISETQASADPPMVKTKETAGEWSPEAADQGTESEETAAARRSSLAKRHELRLLERQATEETVDDSDSDAEKHCYRE